MESPSHTAITTTMSIDLFVDGIAAAAAILAREQYRKLRAEEYDMVRYHKNKASAALTTLLCPFDTEG